MSLSSNDSTSPDVKADGRAPNHLGFLAFTTLCFCRVQHAHAAISPVPGSMGILCGRAYPDFAVYAFSLLAALLMGGSLSDYLGRRPVIFGALLLQSASMLLFILASDVSWLVAARLLQGFATGLAASALGAALLDNDSVKGPLINSISPMLGMAVGALGTALLAEFAPFPLMLGYGLLLAAFMSRALYRDASRKPSAASPVSGNPQAIVACTAAGTAHAVAGLAGGHRRVGTGWLLSVVEPVLAGGGDRLHLTAQWRLGGCGADP